EHSDSYWQRALAKGNLEDYAGSLVDYDRALELDPRNEQAWVGRGWTRRKLGRHAEAVADFTRAAELSPNYALAYSNRGSAKRDLNDRAGAVADWRKAISLRPDFAGELEKLIAELEAGRGRTAPAVPEAGGGSGPVKCERCQQPATLHISLARQRVCFKE